MSESIATGRGRTAGNVGRLLCLALLFGALSALASAGVARADEIAYTCEEDICTIDAANPQTHADLTQTTEYSELHPAWSPDGTEIAFNGDETGDGEVYVLSLADPEHATDISNSASTSDGVPAWSADGTELAWESGTNAGDIYVDFAPADGGGTPRQIAAPSEAGHAQDREPAWSPIDAQLAFSRHTTVFLASPEVSTTAKLLAGGLGTAPAWSPDGKRIAAITDQGDTHVVRLIDADGDGIFTELPVHAELGSSVDWSPDGSHVVYVDENDQVRIAPTDPVGQGFTVQFPPGVIVPHDPTFSPGGAQIAFDARNVDQSPAYEHIYLAPATGGEAVELTKAPQNSD